MSTIGQPGSLTAPPRWRGHTGADVLPPAEIERLCQRLVGVETAALPYATAAELIPSAARPGLDRSIILYAATPLKRCIEADLDCLARGVPMEDPATYIETRAVYLARPGDLSVGRTAPWREAVRRSGVDSLHLPGDNFYYLTHSLLRLAEQHLIRPVPAVSALLARLSATPSPVVRVYGLDPEMQVALLWLKRAAGLARLRVEANGPEISERWNQKSSLHPTAARAAAEPVPADPFAALERESALAPFHRRLGLLVPRLPGYTISRDPAEGPVRCQVTEAVRLLGSRYGLRRGCLKPARAGTGARIETDLRLDDPATVDRIAATVVATDEDYVLEAHAEYVTRSLAGRRFILAPSVHVADRTVQPGMTLQLTSGTVWQGNVYLDRETAAGTGLALSWYDRIRSAAEAINSAFLGGPPGGLIKAGFDAAVARVGGAFGDSVLVGIQDLNLSAHGGEYLRAFLEKNAGDPERRIYAATRVVRPRDGVDLETLASACDRTSSGWSTHALTSVPGAWGMIAAAGPDPTAAFASICRLEAELVGARVVEVR